MCCGKTVSNYRVENHYESMLSPFIFITGLILTLVAVMLVHYRPTTCSVEGFAVTPVDPLRLPACVARSTDAQALLAQIAHVPITDTNAEELRLLTSKLCCIEADLATPTVGVFQTLNLQFRTSHDMEPASSLIGRCRAGAVPNRDIVLLVEKFQVRGHVLVNTLIEPTTQEAQVAHDHFDAVVLRAQVALMSFCSTPAPRMDRPSGPRDPGFWEPTEVSDIATYKGVFLDGDVTFKGR